MEYCKKCSRWFVSMAALQDHQQNSSRHVRTIPCDGCNAFFHTWNALQQHRLAKHNYCAPCERHFRSAQGLAMHLDSLAHRLRRFVCPGRHCSRRCKCAAGLVAHLESGACASGMDRSSVNSLAVDIDQSNIITNPTRLLSYHDGVITTGTVITAYATPRSFNGRSFECFMCHRHYQTLEGLNEHLASPAHDEQLYRCPQALHGCGTEFRTLSALCQHVESEKCRIRRFNAPMQKVIESMASALKGLIL
ncbi:hypothetical protein POSPLADRAFT_1152740 [Postia placenta MAD-698-R-SB12]|uniref:C2H2-type domain-containing protein n=1 Tax=Postia placenta MAD-698-R-SB12 TaxID=670580 RepID=A0A1X6MQ30_9APHY|nr:hypothetical protein POSPLADRAFT_1152740 [Postia placenta MAD-698-R-SB12]OSX58514.1 hypothetical protein POSPLADRAFT_1152740 [Postia placenta MAD-698-R-SB12]